MSAFSKLGLLLREQVLIAGLDLVYLIQRTNYTVGNYNLGVNG